MLIIKEQKTVNDNIVIDISQDEQTNLCSFCSYRTLLKLGLNEYNVKVLSQEIYILSYFFDIQIIDLEDKETIISRKIKLSNNLKTPLFNYQIEGIYNGMKPNNNKWLLLDAPGLGKTLQIIYLAEELKQQKGLEHCLIICGINTLKSNWKKEIKKHSNLTCKVIGEKYLKNGKVASTPLTMKERAEQLRNKIDEFFIIINIESLRSDDIIEAIKHSPNKIEMCAFDEIHKCKSSQSIQGHNILKLDTFKFQIAMTGTMLMNSPLDAYTPLKWIGVEHATLTTFKNMFCEFGGFGGHEIVGFKNLEILKDEIESCSLRRTKDLLDLPPKNIIIENITMNDEHHKFYDAVRKGIKEECDKVELKASNVLALTTRLRQATSCPSVLTTNPVLSSKIERCIDLVEEIITQGDKVVIMSNFKEPVYELQSLLKQYNPLIGTGDMKDSEVSNNVDLFQQEDKYKVFICTASKCGTGITLNRARYMIFIDCPWTDALQTQCEDRIHRVNNTQSVFIYRLVCEETIDELVETLIEKKKAISDFIVDDKVNDDTIQILTKYIKDL